MTYEKIKSHKKSGLHRLSSPFLGKITRVVKLIPHPAFLGLNEYVYNFSVDYNIIDISDINNIHKYLMNEYGIK